MSNKDETIKITQIKEGRIWCGISLTLSSVRSFKSVTEETIFCFQFRNGQSLESQTITGIAKDHVGLYLKNELKEDENYRIQGKIYANPKNPEYLSESSSEFDLYLAEVEKVQQITKNSPSTSSGSSGSFKYDSGLSSLRGKLESGQINFDHDLKDVFIKNGTVYQYKGCETCFTSIRVQKYGKYFCSKCTETAGAKEGQIFTIIQDIKLTDKWKRELTNIVSFEKVTKQLIGSNGNPFLLETAFKDFIGAKINAVIGVNKSNKKGSQVILTLKSLEVKSKVAHSSDDGQNENPEEEMSTPNADLDKELPRDAKNTPTSKDDDDAYKLNSKPPGLVLLINNNHFPYRNYNNGKFRVGSENDVTKIKTTFEKYGYHVKSYMDVKSSELKHIILEFHEELKFKKLDSSVVVIMSHGSNYTIEFVDGENINLKDVIYQFSGEYFPEFMKKPKIFIIEACQKFSTKQEFLEFANVAGTFSDILICFPCLPGLPAYRDPEKGSIFITELCNEIKNSASKFDIIGILKQVQNRLKRYAPKQIKKSKRRYQINWYIDLLFGTFYFPCVTPTPI